MRRLPMAVLLLLATTGTLRADDVGCEGVDPLLDLELVLVQRQ